MEQNKNINIDYQWETVDSLKLKRGKIWYICFTALVVGGLALALWTSNFLLVIIIMLLALIIIFSYYQPTQIIEVIMTDKEFVLDGKGIPYKQIRRFWFANRDDIDFLYIDYDNSLIDQNVRLAILEETNPLKIREILLEHNIEENLDPDEDDVWEMWSRILRL